MCRNAMYCRGHHDAMAQWQRVGFQIPRLGVRIPLASDKIFLKTKLFLFGLKQKNPTVIPPCPAGLSTPWRNGSA